MVMRARSGTLRYIEAEHAFEKLERFSLDRLPALTGPGQRRRRPCAAFATTPSATRACRARWTSPRTSGVVERVEVARRGARGPARRSSAAARPPPRAPASTASARRRSRAPPITCSANSSTCSSSITENGRTHGDTISSRRRAPRTPRRARAPARASPTACRRARTSQVSSRIASPGNAARPRSNAARAASSSRPTVAVEPDREPERRRVAARRLARRADVGDLRRVALGRHAPHHVPPRAVRAAASRSRRGPPLPPSHSGTSGRRAPRSDLHGPSPGACANRSTHRAERRRRTARGTPPRAIRRRARASSRSPESARIASRLARERPGMAERRAEHEGPQPHPLGHRRERPRASSSPRASRSAPGRPRTGRTSRRGGRTPTPSRTPGPRRAAPTPPTASNVGSVVPRAARTRSGAAPARTACGQDTGGPTASGVGIVRRRTARVPAARPCRGASRTSTFSTRRCAGPRRRSAPA